MNLFAEIHSVDEGLSIALALKAENPMAPRETNRKRDRNIEGGEKLKMYDSTERETTRCVGLSSSKLYEERDNWEICRGPLKVTRSYEFSSGGIGRSLPLLPCMCATSHK